MESPTQQTEAEPLSWEKSAVGAEGRELTARDTSSQLDEDHAVMLKSRIVLDGLSDDMWKPEHNSKLSKFVSDTMEQLVIIYVDKQYGLTVCSYLPPHTVQQLAYFVREENAIVTADNFHEVVQFGSIHGSHVDGLLRTLHSLYAPIFFEDTTWPDSFRNDFSGHLHKFMAQLTDAQQKTVGHTVIYVPEEGPKMASPNAHRDKELVQRLEVVVIHWTRQIKEVLATQDAMESADSSGPLEEIEFWRARCEDLSGLTTQLDQPGVIKVVKIIQKAKSSYLAPFQRLSRHIQDSLTKAENCLKFISLLSEPCQELATCEPKAIPSLLPRLLNTVRVIWMNSEHYKSRERLNALLRKISSDIIKRCSTKISLDDIFDGYVERSREALKEGISCCLSWKETYDRVSKMHDKFSEEGWVLDESSIFAQVDAFIQRCKDLLEVVEGQEHFARYSEGKKRPVPCFGGCRGVEVTRSMKEIEHTFDKYLTALKAVRKTILDVKATSWHDDYNKFRGGIKDLEVMVQNVINSAFTTVTTVQEGVELLEVFFHLTTRESIKRVVDRRTVDLFFMFNEELNLVKKEFNRQSPSLTP